MSSPRILLTVDAVGGVWQYGLDLARGLSARGVETMLALLGPGPDAAQRAEAAAIPGARLVETGLPLDWLSDGPTPIVAAGKEIAALAGDLHADLLQFNMPTLAAAAQTKLPTVAVTHGCVATWWQAANPTEPLDMQFHWHRALMAEGLQAVDRLVAPTASYAETVACCYALPRAPQVVHNGRTPLVAAGRALHDRVLTVGRLWDQVKRAALLDRVAARIAVPFNAAGATLGPHGEHIELKHLHLLGQIDGAALGRQLAARPVFVSAASFEPFGLAVLEAASAGCALILSDIASFRELWDGAAVFVSGDDEKAYVDAIETVIGDAEIRFRLGEAASRRAARYTTQAMADAMLGIYADLLAKSARGRKIAA